MGQCLSCRLYSKVAVSKVLGSVTSSPQWERGGAEGVAAGYASVNS